MLPDEPTVDYDCWFQYSFQVESPFFLMAIVGSRERKLRLPRGAPWWWMPLSWLTWYRLSEKAMYTMRKVCQSVPDEAQRKRLFRTEMGVTCPISDIVQDVFADARSKTFLHLSKEVGAKVVASNNYLQFPVEL